MFSFKFQQYRTINEKLDFWRGGRTARGPPFINSKINHYWQTYGNVLFQISAKSHNKYRILLFEGGMGNLKRPHTKRLFQPTPKISAF